MPLVSVIVPVYNIEAYLLKCIDSIQAQTHRNLDIILVNDGSSDSSGSICDQFAERDNRIKVLHQENRGVSAARNSGIDLAKGEFICFVDGDDQIHSRMIELLLEPTFQNSDIDISVCKLITFSERYDTVATIQSVRPRVVSNEIALQELLYQRVINGPVAKLFRRQLLGTIRFPVGVRIGEDLILNIQAFQFASKVALRSEKLYGYYMRPGSAMHCSTHKDRIELIKILEANRGEGGRTTLMDTALRSRIFSESLYTLLILPDGNETGFEKTRQTVFTVFRNHRKSVLFNRKANRFFRVLAALSFLSMRLPRLVVISRRRLGDLRKRIQKLRS